MAGLIPPRALTAEDDREGFDCGMESLNQWFRRYAWRNQQSGASRTSVLRDAVSGSIVGYVSLSTEQIQREFLPKAAQRNQASPLPAILLGQLAVDQRHKGKGYARSLMWYALTTARRLSLDVGCLGVLTHPIDDGVREFYRAFGFEDLPGDPQRSMFVRMTELELNGF